MDLDQDVVKLCGPISRVVPHEILKQVLADLAMGATPKEVISKHSLDDRQAMWVYTDKTLGKFILRYQRVIREEVISRVRRAAQRAAGKIEGLIEEAVEAKDKIRALELILKYFVDLERIELERSRLEIDKRRALNEKKRFDIMAMRTAKPADVEKLVDLKSKDLARLLDHGAKITGIDLSGVENLEEIVDGLRVQGSEEREGACSLDQGEDGGGEEDLATSSM